MSTVAQHIDEAAWLAARRTGIGGSDVAALFGKHPWKSRYQLWLEKTGKVTGDVRETADIRRGRLLEPVAVRLYMERTGNRVRRIAMRRHPEHTFMLASIDRQVFATDDKPTRALEVKCPRSFVFYGVKRNGLPPYAILQGQQESGVWGYPETEYGVFCADDADLITFPIPFDADVWERMVNEAGEFWRRHVQADIPPEEDEVPPPVDLPEISGEVVHRQDDAFAEAARQWFEARDVESEAKRLRDDAKERLTGQMEEHGIYEGGGFRFYWKPQDGRRSFDVKQLIGHGALDPLKVMAWIGERVRRDEVSLSDPEGVGVPAVLAHLRKEWALDLDQFYKQGAAFETLRGYELRGKEL